MQNKVLDFEHEARKTHNWDGKMVTISDIDCERYEKYKRREEYQEEMPDKGIKCAQMFIDSQ